MLIATRCREASIDSPPDAMNHDLVLSNVGFSAKFDRVVEVVQSTDMILAWKLIKHEQHPSVERRDSSVDIFFFWSWHISCKDRVGIPIFA
mmetsp:Transcript_15692/g.22371  ORF Transcript_15692/g.22371 Transcript_15692/m.22371 type:complete len:91 (+) Transcript_15692:24-296(+)